MFCTLKQHFLFKIRDNPIQKNEHKPSKSEIIPSKCGLTVESDILKLNLRDQSNLSQ